MAMLQVSGEKLEADLEGLIDRTNEVGTIVVTRNGKPMMKLILETESETTEGTP